MYIIPQPQKLELFKEHFTITHQARIIIDLSCDMQVLTFAKLLNTEMKTSIGFALAVNKGQVEKGSIYLKISSELQAEEYTLTIVKEGVLLYGGSNAAILFGIQTLRQIIVQEGACLPCLKIKDYPDIPNRGYYLDVTRGRIPTLTYLKAFADKLSYYKINQLQLYIEHSFLFQDLSEVWRDDTPLTAEEILELDEYCSSLHIELIPSIATFGHLYKLLCTKAYSKFCELSDPDKQPFSYVDRMMHHTIDPTNEQSLIIVKKMIDEYLPLFRSKHFNICADETFDLGKGKSKALADEFGIDTIYMNYVKELCDYLIIKGKKPMFWGDIVCGFPEAIKQLPEETICLNWGYAPDQSEESTRLLDQAGATQYLCPGVGGWNQFINQIDSSYENIMRMCSYSHKYHALGVLNTDWGDYGHINHPEFGTAGMIYGAAFSWNHELPKEQDINKQISLIEYGDSKEAFVDLIASLAKKSVFEWYHIVRYMELDVKGKSEEESKKWLTSLDFSKIQVVNDELSIGIQQLYEGIHQLALDKRVLVKPYIVAAEGIQLFNTIGATISQLKYQQPNEAAVNPSELAKELEHWFYRYKELWRSVSKESELYRIQNVILWYADLLRTL